MIVVASIAALALACLTVVAHRRHRARTLWEAVDLQIRAYNDPTLRGAFPGGHIPINQVLRYARYAWRTGANSREETMWVIQELAPTPGWATYWETAQPAWEAHDPRFAALITEALQRR